MISICVPSRGRPTPFREMAESAKATAEAKIEVVCWLDDDDPTAPDYPQLPYVRYTGGPREVQSNLWNRCWAEAQGGIAMLGGDDILFITPRWDRMVKNVLNQWPDRLGMAWGRDQSEWEAEPTLPFVTRQWIEVTGTFTPPYFHSWYADRWIWEVAEQVDRDREVPGLLFDHRRWDYAKSGAKLEKDATYRDAIKARAKQNPGRLYASPKMLAERQEQAMRLCRAIRAAQGPVL